MLRKSKYLAVVVIVLGLAGIAVGATFIAQGQAKADYMKDAMRQEQITLGLDEEAVARGEVVDTAAEAEKAGDTVREHRHGIAESYSELGRYDPENPEHLSYAQALNLENYLYLSVAGFGLTTVVMASGLFMIIAGIALVLTGGIMFALARKAV
ncbi:hypothetical protein ACFLW2_04815 [Chloroflexota bacterium]